MNTQGTNTTRAQASKPTHTGLWIGVGLLLGLLCGLLFGEYCAALQLMGQAYVGLLQMTVLPYLILSLVAKTGRLDMQQARKLGLAALVVLLLLWLIGIVLIVFVSTILPPAEGASFYSPAQDVADATGQEVLSRFIPANVFYALSEENVPAIVVFCLFFGGALIMVPGKEPLLDFLDLCATAIGRINLFLVRLAPIGLFALTAAAAGTLRLEELARLQAYLIMFALACLVAAFGILPLLLSSLTDIRYRAIAACRSGAVAHCDRDRQTVCGVTPDHRQVRTTASGRRRVAIRDRRVDCQRHGALGLSVSPSRQDPGVRVHLIRRVVRGTRVDPRADHGHGGHGRRSPVSPARSSQCRTCWTSINCLRT